MEMHHMNAYAVVYEQEHRAPLGPGPHTHGIYKTLGAARGQAGRVARMRGRKNVRIIHLGPSGVEDIIPDVRDCCPTIENQKHKLSCPTRTK